MTKRYFTIEERIAKLKGQGLIIEDDGYAVMKINEIGYYKLINCYRTAFFYRDENRYFDGIKFQNIVSLYDFDNNLRNITLKYLCNFETLLKSLVADKFSEKYGIDEKKYLVKENFNIEDEKVDKFFSSLFSSINKTINEYEKSKEKEPYIFSHAVINYYNKHGFFPLWVVFTTLTFGDISCFYSRMKNEEKENDQAMIAKYFGIPNDTLKSYVHNLTIFRNVCAHNEVLYSFKTRNRIKTNFFRSKYKRLGIPLNSEHQYEYGVQDFFSLVFMFRHLLRKDYFFEFVDAFKYELLKLKKNISDITFANIYKCLGLFEGWEKIYE